MLWSKEFAEAVFSDRNFEDKTPLQLAVEKGHVKWDFVFWDMTSVANNCFFINLSAYWRHLKPVFMERGSVQHHDGTIIWRINGGTKLSPMSSMLLHVDHWVLSNTLLQVARNQPSGIWINSQCPSVEDCAACFEYVDVTNTVQCRYCNTDQSTLILLYYLSLNQAAHSFELTKKCFFLQCYLDKKLYYPFITASITKEMYSQQHGMLNTCSILTL